MVAVRRHNLALCLNRPIYAGFSILELSKVLMHSFRLKYIKKRGPRALLRFTDTESLLLGGKCRFHWVFNLFYGTWTTNYKIGFQLFCISFYLSLCKQESLFSVQTL